MWISFFGAMRAEFLMMTNRFYFYLFLPQLWRTPIHPFLSSIFSPARLLLLFTLPMPDDFSLTDPPFRLFRILVWLVPLPNAIKPLNNWVRPGQCSLVIVTLDSIRITVEFQVVDRKLWMILRTLDASSSCFLASLAAADPASSVFLSALLGLVWLDGLSGLRSVPEVDVIFLWVNRNALLCAIFLRTHLSPHPLFLSPFAYALALHQPPSIWDCALHKYVVTL